jgi:hypothetical protein
LEVLEDRTVLSPLLVSNTNDSGNGSLRAAVTAADLNPGSTIDFAHGLHGTITLTSGPLDITSSTTINGPGADKLAVSGNNASGIFDISGSADVSIAGLTLTNGLATAGGAILLQGSAALSLSHCRLTDNVALGNAAGTGVGGGIEDTSAGALNVANCTFDANKAIATGANTVPGTPGYAPGYIIALGGGIDLSFVASGSATISDSTFTGNQALGGAPGASAGGGALSNSSNTPGTTMTVTGCTLCGNAAIGEAGGDGVVNFGSGQGGGINDFDNLTILNSTLTDNLAQGAPLAPGAVPSQAPSNGSSTVGGGVLCLGFFVPAPAVDVADCTFIGNQAVGGAGAPGSAGSVGEGGGLSLAAIPSALVTDCTLAYNVAQGGAGGTGGVGASGVSGGFDLTFGSVVTVSNTILIGNQAIGGAGGAGAKGGNGVGGGANVGSGVITGFADNSSLTLIDSLLIGNQAIGGAGGSGSNGGNGLGGGLSILAGSSASINTSALVGNLALGGEGGSGGSDGEGIGGGVYNLGNFTELAALIVGNFASTSNDNIYP